MRVDQQSTDLAEHILRHASKQRPEDMTRLAQMLQQLGERPVTDAEKIKVLQQHCDAADAVISDMRSADIRRQAEIASIAQQLHTAQEQNDLLRGAAGEFFKWFENSGSAISARWDRIPPEDRVKIVNRFRAALRG